MKTAEDDKAMSDSTVRGRMVVLAVSAALVLLALPAGQAAQFQQTNPVHLVVNVYVGSMLNPAPFNVTVQMLSSSGLLQKEAHTDNSGRVEFQTLTETKQLRIFGPGIEEHTETVEIESVESRKLVNIIVKPKVSGTGDPGSLPATGTVSAARLNAPGKAEKEFRKGSDALTKKDWAEAKKRFETAVAIYPEYDVAYNGLGAALLASGDAKSARPAFEKAIALNGGFSEAYRNLARISLADHNYEELENLLVRSLDSDPLNPWALTYSAYAELQLRKFDEAILHARKAHSVEHKGLASVHIVSALALEAVNLPAEAAEEYRTYLIEDPAGRDAAKAKSKVAELKGQGPR